MPVSKKERTATAAIISLEKQMEEALRLHRADNQMLKLLLLGQNVQKAASLSPVNLSDPTTPTQEGVDFPQVVQVDPNAPARKRVVQEKITYGDSKIIILAQVEVFDMDGALIGKVRTNNAGKWTLSLMPGKYTVRVAKQQTANKPQATGQYEIIVPPGNKPLQLGSRKL